MQTEDGEMRVMTFQVADVTKPLASVGLITSRGPRIVLDDGGVASAQRDQEGGEDAQERQRLRHAHADHTAAGHDGKKDSGHVF